MTIDRIKQVEIFCAFVIDFKKIKTTVSEMVYSENEQDIKRVEKMCAFIADIVVGTESADDILAKISEVSGDDRLNKLLAYIKALFNKDKDLVYSKIMEHYKVIDQLIEINHLKRNVDEIFSEEVITSDATAPIEEDDLNLLNWIAKLSVENRKEMEEAEKLFKTLPFREKIRTLYHKNLFYFEQVFSNADVSIQKRILTMIRDYHQISDPTDEQKEALATLEDIGLLSDIDTLAIKSKSNVSDHQAFDAFCKILRRNNNKKLLNKVLRENIIMTSMFKTNSTTIGEFYALRKMFVSARYPYNKVIIQRYMQLLEKSEADMGLIFKLLKKDFEFNKSYEKYVKSEDTADFKKLVLNVLIQLEEDDISDGMCETLTFIVESFIYMDKHDSEILTQKDVYQMLDQIYVYVIRNRLFERNIPLIQMLSDFRYARIQSDFSDRNSLYYTEETTVLYGVYPGDVWYDLNKYIIENHIEYISKIYLKYNEISIFVFEVGNAYSKIDRNREKIDFNNLPKNERLIICADVDKVNFDMYIFGIYSRMARSMFGDLIEVQLSSVTGSLFKKKIEPGFEKEMEPIIRKIILSILSMSLLMQIDQRLFVHIYMKKVKPLLEEMNGLNIKDDDISEFVKFNGEKIRNLKLENKDFVQLLLTQLERFSLNTKEEFIYDHAKRFVKGFDFLNPKA